MCVFTSSSQSEHSRARCRRKAKLPSTMQANAKTLRRAQIARPMLAQVTDQRLAPTDSVSNFTTPTRRHT